MRIVFPLRLSLAALCGIQSFFAAAQQDTDVEAARPPVFDFNTMDLEAASKSTGIDDVHFITYGGYIQQTGAYRYEADDFQFGKFQSTLNLHASGNLSTSLKFKLNAEASYDTAFAIEGRDEFSKDTLDTYESDSRLLEGYLDMDVNSWMNVRLGRQYFSWGESEGKQISDIGNSRDYREMGLQDVEDARLSVGSTKITFYGNSWEYNFIALNEFRPHEMGAEGSVYDPFLAARRAGVIITDGDEPDNLKNPELISRLFLSTSLGDFSFFVGDTYDDLPVFSVKSYNTALTSLHYEPFYEKFVRVGSFGNAIVGSWLFKYDIAKSLDKPFNRNANNIVEQIQQGDDPVIGHTYADFLQTMVGVEYSGISETFISIEFYRESIDNHVINVFEDDQDSTEISLYISRDFYNDRMVSTFWTNFLLDDDSTMFRIDTSYDVNDHLSLMFAVTGINSSKDDSYFFDYRKTDRVELSVKYSF